jgi:hypothetical protein
MAGLIGLFTLVWIIGLWILFIWAAGTIAKTKGRSFGNWGWLAFAYGGFAVIAVYLMPPLGRPRREDTVLHE